MSVSSFMSCTMTPPLRKPPLELREANHAAAVANDDDRAHREAAPMAAAETHAKAEVENKMYSPALKWRWMLILRLVSQYTVP